MTSEGMSSMRAIGPLLALSVVTGAARAHAQAPPDAGPAAPGIQRVADIESIEDRAKPWSEGVSFEHRRRARDLFLQANELAQGRFLATAVVRYRDALALWPHPAFHYNLAVVQIGLNDPVSAYRSLQEALRHGADGLDRDKHEEARRYQTILLEQLARVVIVCDAPGAQVTLDGKPLVACPGRHEAVLRPGGYHVEAAKSGYISDSRHLILPAGQEVRLDMVVSRWAAERRWAGWAPWTTVTLGAALAVTGGVFHVRAASAFDRYDSALAQVCGAGCVPGDELTAGQADELERLRDRGARQRTFAAVAYGAGGLALASGAALLYLNRERQVLRPARGTAGELRGGGAALVPLVSPDVLGVSALLKF